MTYKSATKHHLPVTMLIQPTIFWLFVEFHLLLHPFPRKGFQTMVLSHHSSPIHWDIPSRKAPIISCFWWKKTTVFCWQSKLCKDKVLLTSEQKQLTINPTFCFVDNLNCSCFIDILFENLSSIKPQEKLSNCCWGTLCFHHHISPSALSKMRLVHPSKIRSLFCWNTYCIFAQIYPVLLPQVGNHSITSLRLEVLQPTTKPGIFWPQRIHKKETYQSSGQKHWTWNKLVARQHQAPPISSFFTKTSQVFVHNLPPKKLILGNFGIRIQQLRFLFKNNFPFLCIPKNPQNLALELRLPIPSFQYRFQV